MAQAVAKLTVNPHPFGYDNTQRRQLIFGLLLLSAGGTYVTNGIPLPWTVGQLSTQTQPALAYFFSQLGGGYNYVYDQTHNTLRIFNGGTELANNAAIVADTIGFEAQFVKGL